MAKQKVSEYTSYIYIKKELKNLGWNTSNPARNNFGELYTQQECLSHPEIKQQLDKQKPEYVAKITEDKFYVIEAKARIEDLETAFEEAKEYAEEINHSAIISAPIISGVAGNDEDGYLVKSAYLDNGSFEVINYHGKDITSLVSTELANELLENDSSSIPELVINEKQLLRVAEKINNELHNASINKDERASVMSTILLSMLDETLPNYEASPEVFVKDINSRAENVLIHNSKREFFKHIEIKLPSKKDAQKKYKDALVTTMFLLLKINIKAAMNSGSDVLGQFYEVFLKYGNGAKDIGIVLTPRHITEFVARVLEITHRDIVYDPTCGTGGFLVAAYDYVRRNCNQKQLNEFKKRRIFGIEQQPRVAALAIVNMIFRGDGKNNIIDDNCLAQKLDYITLNGEPSAEYVGKEHSVEKPPINKVLMNPPFALQSKDEKEYKFVDHALEQMEDGGLLFSVLPVSVMIKGGAARKWRKNKLLKSNRVLSVITFPHDLFYPVGVNTCGVFIRKGIPHEESHNVLWLRAIYDGFEKMKGKRLFDPTLPNYINKYEDTVSEFINNPEMQVEDIPQVIKSCPVDFDDTQLELVPEFYLDTKEPQDESLHQEMDKLMREHVAYLIRTKKID